jgi:hypothetical protein
MMKRIIYFLSFVLIAALYSCTGQYDNIDKYATDETIYVGKFSDDPFIRVGYKRLEIELMGDSIGRAFSDDLYLGKAKRTVVEYDEADGRRIIEFDSVCSWVNIKGLTTAKTYIFTVYAEDEYGNRSTPVEILGKPYTDADFQGIVFPQPRVIAAPTTVEFAWENEVSEGLSSPLYKFVELIYSYVDSDNNTVSGKVTAKDVPSFSIRNLSVGDSTSVILNCRIIPIMDRALILDTLSIVKEIFTKTTTAEEYLAARTVRPVVSGLINPANENDATITFGAPSAHLVWTEIRYWDPVREDSTVIHIENSEASKLCPNFERRGTVQIRGSFSPPETDIELTSAWTDWGKFILKRSPRQDGWVAIPRHGNHGWGDGQGAQSLWGGGSPMLAFDDPDLPNNAGQYSGWHSVLYTAMPQVFIVDMKAARQVSSVYIKGDYYITVELYLTDDLSIPGYQTHTIDWNANNRESAYNSWRNQYHGRIPGDVPASWGRPVLPAVNDGGHERTINLPANREGRFLILRFPNSTSGTGSNYIDIKNLIVYSD